MSDESGSARYTGKVHFWRDLRAIFPEILLSCPSTPLFNRLRATYYRRRMRLPIGREVHLFKGVHLKGDVRIGDHVVINEYCKILSTPPGTISIGDHTIIAPFVFIRNANHGFARTDIPIRLQPKQVADIVIGPDCWLGEGVTVLPGVTIGRGTVIGAGAVVTRSLPDYAIAVGVPARVVRHRPTGAEPGAGSPDP